METGQCSSHRSAIFRNVLVSLPCQMEGNQIAYELKGQGFILPMGNSADHICGLVVRVPGYRSRGPGFDSLRSSVSGTESTQTREDN
jgi:hypothetical protein